MRSADRPISPHLQIYRWQLTSVLSILHRAAGVWLGGGTGVLVWWVIAASWTPEAFDAVPDVLNSWLGLLLLFGWSVALFYHLCNGIRHLVWDTGHGLDLKSTYLGGWFVLGGTAALTLFAWVAAISGWA